MKKLFNIILCYLILLSGCSSSHQLVNYEEFNQDYISCDVEVILGNGEIIEGKLIYLGSDSTIYKQSASEGELTVPCSEIAGIITRDHGQGAIEGAGVGLLTGSAIIAVLSLIFTDSSDDFGMAFAIGSIYITLPITFLSLIIGAIAGHKDNYKIAANLPEGFLILSDFQITEQSIQADYMPKRVEYVKVIVSSIIEENEKFIRVLWEGKEIQLNRFQFFGIEKIEDKIYIKISKQAYQSNFKK